MRRTSGCARARRPEPRSAAAGAGTPPVRSAARSKCGAAGQRRLLRCASRRCLTAKRAGQIVTCGHLDDDRPQPTLLRGQTERRCHRRLPHAALGASVKQPGTSFGKPRCIAGVGRQRTTESLPQSPRWIEARQGLSLRSCSRHAPPADRQLPAAIARRATSTGISASATSGASAFAS
jgi:hypothetical protein